MAEGFTYRIGNASNKEKLVVIQVKNCDGMKELENLL
jgi:hypothetical protein